MKALYRKEVTAKKVRGEAFDSVALVEELFEEVRAKGVAQFARHGWQVIEGKLGPENASVAQI